MAEEVAFYSDDKGVKITNTRAIFESKTYAMNNITSVSTGYKAPSRGGAVVAVLIGILILLISIGAKSIGGSIFGLLVIALGVWLYTSAKASYSVKIGSASGEATALESKDEKYIQSIVQAMNEAIIKRG